MNNIEKINLPNQELWAAIESQQHAYAGNHILGIYGTELAETEYRRCLQWFQERFPDQSPGDVHRHIPALLNLMSNIKQKEEEHRDELEELAREMISEFFGIPEQHFSKASIDDSFELQDDTPVPGAEIDPNKLLEHVNKRILLNAIVHGGAVNCWKTIHILAKGHLDQIDPALAELYSDFTSLSSMMMWQSPPLPDLPDAQRKEILGTQNIKQGQNQVSFENDEAEIAAQATCFPVLLHELIKGVLDLVSLHGLDQSLTEDEQQYIMNQADKHWDERWYYLFGPGLWDILMEQKGPKSKEIAELQRDLSLETYPKLVAYFQNQIEDAKDRAANKT